jgi:hypothetical protein
MSRVDKIVTSQIDGSTGARNEPNTYSYNSSGILVRHDSDRVGKSVVGPGVLYGANKDSADQSGLNTIKLIPNEDINTDQYIIIEPTAPNHIHIRAGGTQDASSADLFLGGETTNIVISDSLDSVILNGSSGEYIGNSLNANNQIATIGDLNTATSTLGDGGWVNITSLSNSFVSGGTTPAYRKLNGVIYFRGNLNSGTANTVAFTLPAGHRPGVESVFLTQKFGTALGTYVTILADGSVKPQESSTWLSGISFPV